MDAPDSHHRRLFNPKHGAAGRTIYWHRYHLDEHLSACLDLCTTAKTRRAQRKRWHDKLLSQENGAATVIRSLRRAARGLSPDDRRELSTHIGYLKRNRHRMRYASCRQRGLPIGSGVTEGARKSVIAARAKRSGLRWSQRGLTAALHFRSVHQSDRFESFWFHFTRYYRARSITPTAGATVTTGA